jgi:hypothetical protein
MIDPDSFVRRGEFAEHTKRVEDAVGGVREDVREVKDSVGKIFDRLDGMPTAKSIPIGWIVAALTAVGIVITAIAKTGCV